MLRWLRRIVVTVAILIALPVAFAITFAAGVTMERLTPRPKALMNAPLKSRSRLAVLSVLPRSTRSREFCRTWKDALPIRNTTREATPVSTSSPVCTIC